jgi:AmiR/NasT family two-component response regulator
MAMGVEKRRVLLLDLPRMLAELVRQVGARDEGLEVVGDVTEAQAPGAVAQMHPDFVIVGGDRTTPPDSCRAVFDSQPHLTVLALTGNGSDGVLWELAPHREALGDLSQEALLNAMREVRQWRWDG